MCVCVCVDSDPVLLANDTVCNSGSWVEFMCDNGTIWWLGETNLAYKSQDNSYVINLSERISTLNLTCLLKFNGSNIFCINIDSNKQSNYISFLVQGEYR